MAAFSFERLIFPRKSGVSTLCLYQLGRVHTRSNQQLKVHDTMKIVQQIV